METLISIAIGASVMALYIFVRSYSNARATGAELIEAAKYAGKVVYKGGQGIAREGMVRTLATGGPGIPRGGW